MPNLETVTLPAGLTSIPKDAFLNSAKLVTVNFGDASTNNGGGSGPSGRAVTGDANAITLPSKIATIGQNAFQGTGFTTVDLSKATGTQASTGGAAQTTPLTVGAGAFTNMADLTTVKLPANANINPADFGNPADATEQKLTSITYVGADSATPATATATTGNDANISSTNFSKIKNQVIEIKSSVGGSTISFSGGVFNGNETMTTLKLSLATGTRNGNNPL